MKQLAALLLCLLALPALAQDEGGERILDFHSSILIDDDGSMTVTEDIQVLAEGVQIRRGIFRDFPTAYKDAYGNPVNVGFKLLAAERDGRPEPHHTKPLANGIRIYLGDRSVLVAPGEHRYRITYRTTHQIGYFEKGDELYWNVTGNGWIFPIDHASARIKLPQAVPAAQLTAEAYVGTEGAKGRAWTAKISEPGVAEFETTRALGAGEGLTVVFGFPRKIVGKPLLPYQFTSWMFALIALAVAFVVHYRTWSRIGRDPAGRAIYPLYTPPAGCSPALLGTVWRHRHDEKCFAADLVSLAARGVISILHDPPSGLLNRLTSSSGSEWKLRKIRDVDSLSRSEQILLRSLPLEFGMDFGPSYGDAVVKATRKHAAELRSGLKPYFKGNYAAMFRGIGASFAVAAAMLLMRRDFDLDHWIAILLGLLGGIMLARPVAGMLIEEFPRKLKNGRYFSGLLYGLFVGAIAIGGLAAVSLIYASFLGLAMGVLLAALMAVNGVFIAIMKAYTPEGRKLLDHIEGLRLYMSVAEKTDLEREKVPPLTAERYQALMPFAIALDVEEAWSRKLTEVAGAAVLASIPAHSVFSHDMGGQLSSFSSAASSCAPPSASSSSGYSGSSSGGGGGGSSGGGGGGGGGGGW